MAQHHRFLGDLSWFQVIGSAAAAVTAAWVLSRLGATGTLVGAAVGSVVVTLTTAFYSHTLDRGRTMVIRTDRGTVVENPTPAEAPRPLNPWLVVITILLVLLIALVGISALELARGETFSGDKGTTIGGTVSGGEPPVVTPEPTETTPSPSPTTPSPTEATPTPTEPTATEPTPTPSPPTATINP